MKHLLLVATLILCGQFSFAQDYSKDVTFTANNVINATQTTNAATSDITYLADGGSYNLEIKDNSTFTIDLQSTYTLFTRGSGDPDDNTNAVELVIDEGSMLIIDGNLDVGAHTDIVLNGNMIITGDLLNSDRLTNGGYGDIDINGNGLIYIGGQANLDFVDPANAKNIFIEESYETPNDGSRLSDAERALLDRNLGSNPFSTDDGLNVDQHNYDLNLWEGAQIDPTDQGNGELTTEPFTAIKVETASGWYNQYIKLRGEGFDDGELSSSSIYFNSKITSLDELEDILQKIKWSVKNATVNDNVLLHHGGSDRDGFTDPIKTEITDYFADTRKIIVSFVDGASEIEYIASSGKMMAATVEEIIINTDDGDLPVELIFFNGIKNEDQTVTLNWATATEINNEKFDIYRSTDKIKWEKIGTVASQAGNSNYRIDYKFIDSDPSTKNYYKLVQVDYDGSSETFGPIQVISENTGILSVEVFPNPLANQQKGQLHIKGMSINTPTQVSIYTKYGKMIDTFNINEQNQTSYIQPLEYNLPSGMYFIRVVNGVEVANAKLLLK
ncbi:T9SS type A sorting domain-containing protein [Flammeovirga sp. MY04]|nr:T9SS type A sorting domain-containing protein [Flammeovirga sp. MY04]ANQ48034.1 T9SS type A sorting domain-containing protein [Flammeovirga sp. MY04]